MEARSRSWFLYTIISTFTRNVRNNILPFGFFPGAKRFIPVSVQSDQLLCLPEPFTPLYGFSCSSTAKLCLRAMRFIKSITNWLWSLARLAFSKMGANSNWLGATSLWRVLTGMPSLWHSISSSFIKAVTRGGIEPK